MKLSTQWRISALTFLFFALVNGGIGVVLLENSAAQWYNAPAGSLSLLASLACLLAAATARERSRLIQENEQAETGEGC